MSSYYLYVEPGKNKHSVHGRTVQTERQRGPEGKFALGFPAKQIGLSRREALDAAIGIILASAADGDTDALAEIKAFIKRAEEMEA